MHRAAEVLPSGYQRVNYIHGDGVAFIVTQFRMNGDYTYNIKFTYSADNKFLFGVNSNVYCMVRPSSIWNYMEKRATPAMTQNTLYTASINKTRLVLNGAEYALNSTTQPSSVSMNMYSGAITDSRRLVGNIYYLNVTDTNGNFLFNAIPCYRIADNVAGFYDTIGGTFYTNHNSSGQFTIG